MGIHGGTHCSGLDTSVCNAFCNLAVAMLPSAVAASLQVACFVQEQLIPVRAWPTVVPLHSTNGSRLAGQELKDEH